VHQLPLDVVVGSAINLVLFYYPSNQPIDILSSADERSIEFITYKSGDYKTREAEESFRELYSIVKSRFLGMNQVLDAILNDPFDDLPF